MTPVQRNTLDFEMLFWSHLSLDNLKKCLKGRSSMQLLVPEPGVSAGGRRLGGPGGVKTAEASVWSGGRDSRPGAGSLGPTSAHCSPMWGRAAPRLAVRTGRKGTEASQAEKRQGKPTGRPIASWNGHLLLKDGDHSWREASVT